MSQSDRNRLGRNDPCWCGSGEKYKKCHLNRQEERPTSLPEASTALRKFFKAKRCLHPLASRQACGKVIAAHSIQANGPLKAILDETGHCLTFYPPSTTASMSPHRRGWREASTFAGFCEEHDGPTFAALESAPFTGTAEQVFLIAYRAECHEVYQKRASHRSHESMRQMLDRGQTPVVQRAIQHMSSITQLGVTKGLDEAVKNKTRMDQQFLNGDFSGFDRVFLKFDGPLCVASTGACTPNKLFTGEQLQTLHDPDAVIQRVYIGPAANAASAGIVFAWRPGDDKSVRFMNELLRLPISGVPRLLVQYLFAHVENTFFSAVWWSALPDRQKRHIAELAMMGNPYYDEWSYLDELAVPWTSLRFTENWS